MGRFFNEIMKGKKFIPPHMEALRQEFRNRPPVVEVPLAVIEHPKELTIKEKRQAQALKMREAKKAKQEALVGQATGR